MAMTAKQRKDAAAALVHAENTREWMEPITPTHDDADIADAYATGQAVTDLGAAAGIGTVRVGEIPRPLLAMLGLVSPVMRELPEVAHQLEHDFVLDSTAAQRTFGLGPTPWEEQVERQVAAYRR